MKRSLFLFGSTLMVLCIVEPAIVHAATTSPFFGPMIDPACNCDQAAGYTGTSGVHVATSAPAWGCILETFQRLMNFGVSIAVIIITIFIALAGFTYMTSGGSAEKRSLANKRIMNAVIGLIIVMCAYLLVDSLMKVLYNPSAPNLGPWNSILAGNGTADCLAPVQAPPQLPGIGKASNAQGGSGVTTPQAAAVPAGGDIPSKICSAANAYKGTSTAGGPGGGTVSCAWAVNNVLANAGLAAIGGNAVSGMESALQGGRGTAESQSSAVCGDIVIQAGDGHVGICLNNGCSQVISNSSSHATFSWISGPDFAPSYSGGVGRFYRVTN